MTVRSELRLGSCIRVFFCESETANIFRFTTTFLSVSCARRLKDKRWSTVVGDGDGMVMGMEMEMEMDGDGQWTSTSVSCVNFNW